MSAEPNKNSFFTIMLNPKKVKKMLEKESEELNNIELGRTRRKPMSKSRRQMMLTNRHEINN